jgi:hypothetical protein
VIKLQSAIAAIEAPENPGARAGYREPLPPEETDPRKLALAILNILHAAREK